MIRTRLGQAAVKQLLTGNSGSLVGLVGGDLVTTLLEKVCSTPKPLDDAVLELTDIMAI